MRPDEDRTRAELQKERIAADFSGLHEEMHRLEQAYKPSDENLHVWVLERVDAPIYAELLGLAEAGLRLVRR